MPTPGGPYALLLGRMPTPAALAASSVATAASGRRRVSTAIDACGLTQSIVAYGRRRYPGVGGLSL